MTKVPPGVLCVDRVKPTIAITSPAAGTVSGTITIAASAADNDQVASVQFRIDGANLGAPVTSSPYQITQDTHGLVNGGHTYSAIVTDRVGNQQSTAVSVTVANTPAVNMTSPGNGANVSGVMTLAATVTGYGTGLSVQFQVDGSNVGAAQISAPFSVNYDTRALVNGNHTCTVIVTDSQNNQTVVNQTVTFKNVPLVTVTSPGSGASVSGIITLQASVTSYGAGTTTAQWKVDGNNVGAPVTSPYSTSHDTRGLVNGSHTYSVTITDAQGNSSTASVTAVFHNLPVVTMTSPGNGATVTGTITIAASVTQYGSSCTVQFQIDGSNFSPQSGGNGNYSVGYDTHYLGVGWHTATTIVTDAQGNSTTVSQSIYVNNAIPGAGTVTLGDHALWDDGEAAYDSYRHSPPSSDDSQYGNWIWTQTGAKYTAVFLPGNPDPTHYQMRVWMHGERVEGGSDGNVCYMDFQIGGVVGWTTVWANGPTWGFNVGPLWNVGGGNDCYAHWYCSWPGNNTCFCQGIGFYYDFVVKSGYNS